MQSPTMLEWLDRLADAERDRFARTFASIGGPRERVEIVATGIDESLQDRPPALSWEGLRVPFAPVSPPGEGTIGVGNYLFLGSYFELGEGERKRIRGLGLLHKIGLDLNAVVGHAQIIEELAVTTPTWRFRDGFVTYHLREISPTLLGRLRRGAGPLDTNNFAFRMSKSSALLYENATFPAGHLDAFGRPDYYVFLNGYVPPNGGVAYGNDVGGLGTIYDPSRFPYTGTTRWQSTDSVVEGGGPGTAIGLFIRVRQTNPATRPKLPGVPTITTGISEEEQFLLNYPNAIEWRVGSALVVEDI
jgi:hypothetical protein